MQLVNCRVRVTLTDGRTMLGQLLAFDKHMNLVLADCEEFRLTKKQKSTPSPKTSSDSTLGQMRRTLGMILLRGETIVSMIPESGPPPAGGNKARIPASRQMAPPTMTGRPPMGVPPPGAPPSGLAGPVPGMYGGVPGGMPMYPPPGAPMHGMPPGYPYPPPPQQ